MAAALDGVDGWVARRTRTASAFGARFDMETDALLILVLSALVWRVGKAGAVGRRVRPDAICIRRGGMAWPWMQEPLEPSRRRQAVCVVQIVALIVAPAAAGRAAGLQRIAAAALAALAGLSWWISCGCGDCTPRGRSSHPQRVADLPEPLADAAVRWTGELSIELAVALLLAAAATLRRRVR